MFNFTYHNPVKIVFGRGSIAEVENLISKDKKVLMTYGGGSIKKNGVYEQVKKALKKHTLLEFGGIEPNPQFDTLMKAVVLGKREKIDFILAVGGGSVADGSKFIAAAIDFDGKDPWDILAKNVRLKKAVPLGCILTLPATGSEMNGGAVVSRASTREKLFFISPVTFPQFSILDPETTFTLPVQQTINGIVDAYVHVTEQYLTYPVNGSLQDRQAEAVLQTLIENAPRVLAKVDDYDARANVMWAATHALNGLVGCGVPQDWTTHMIGHELTALYGLDHAQTLAIVHPCVLTHQKLQKAQKLIQYVGRVWNVTSGSDEEKIDAAIEKTIGFFNSIEMPTSLKHYKIGSENFQLIADRLESKWKKLGERQLIGKKEIIEILTLALQ